MPKVRTPRPTRTVAQFLAGLPAERRRELARVRSAVKKHLPAGYEEVAEGSMIVYRVPPKLTPETYNGRPLWYAALAAPKSYLTLHLMPVYASPDLLARLRAGFERAGKKLDIGKACIRFRRADDLALEAVGMAVAAVPLKRWIALALAARAR